MDKTSNAAIQDDRTIMLTKEGQTHFISSEDVAK